MIPKRLDVGCEIDKTGRSMVKCWWSSAPPIRSRGWCGELALVYWSVAGRGKPTYRLGSMGPSMGMRSYWDIIGTRRCRRNFRGGGVNTPDRALVITFNLSFTLPR